MSKSIHIALTMIAVLLLAYRIFCGNVGLIEAFNPQPSTTTSQDSDDPRIPDGQDVFPSRAIQIVVPYLAGGGTDNFARILQLALTKRDEIQVPWVIVNQDGGSATIGSRMVKDASPDGYKILCHHEGIIATKLAEVVDYGPEAFTPIAQTGSIVLLMVVRADSPYQSLPDLLKAAQQNPNTIRVGANQGSPAYFICKQLLAEYPGAEFNFVSASGSKRYTFLMGNKLEAGIFSLAEYKNFRADKQDSQPSEDILAIGNFGEQRHPAIPDVSTSLEQGLKTSAENAYYFWAPRETPSPRIEKIADALHAAINDPETRVALDNLSIDPTFRRAQELEQHLAKRVGAFEALAVKADAELPDFASWMIGLVGFMLCLVVYQAATNREQHQDSDHESHSSPDIPAFNGMAFTCLAILMLYVLSLQMGIPFPWATAATVFLLGLAIAEWNPAWILSVAQLAIIFSISLEYVFTQIFTVVLP